MGILEICGKEEVEAAPEHLMGTRARTDLTEDPSMWVGKAAGWKEDRAPKRKESERRAAGLAEEVVDREERISLPLAYCFMGYYQSKQRKKNTETVKTFPN